MKASLAGFTLVEILVALLLGSLLLAGLMTIYLTVKSTSRAQIQLTSLQERVRFTAYNLSSGFNSLNIN